MTQQSLLVVEDDASAQEFLTLTLREAGYRVRTAGNGVEGLLAIEARAPDLIVSDLQMPVMDGVEFLRQVKQRWPGLPVVVLTVVQDVEVVVKAIQLGAINYLLKPCAPAVLISTVRSGLAPRPVRPAPSQDATEIMGASRNVVEVRRLLALASRCDVNVLVVGPTGTGKELVARAIHRGSRVSGSPFVAQNCAATPSELFESEFFGHCRGAFTGAAKDRVGLFEQANHGVLFLDELESLSRAHQAKLLRVLDDGVFRPVGATRTRQAVVRVIAATNREPAEMMQEGTLREDLYFRLRGFEIRLAPLAERAGDIPLLAAHFLGAASSKLSPEAAAMLQRYPWPGNVRELRNVLRSALVQAGEGWIRPEHLSLDSSFAVRETTLPTLAATATGSLKDLERTAILQALRRHGGNRSLAARSLGIDRSTLRRKMKETCT